eukprot:2890921-Amphidinium_carterae.1
MQYRSVLTKAGKSCKGCKEQIIYICVGASVSCALDRFCVTACPRVREKVTGNPGLPSNDKSCLGRSSQGNASV